MISNTRKEEMEAYFWDETNDPESEEWSEDLTDEEEALVAEWDERVAVGMSRMSWKILDQNNCTEKQLFKCETMEQFKIMSWLKEQGITQDDIAEVSLLNTNKVRIVNPAGQYMILDYRDGEVSIDQSMEQPEPPGEEFEL